MSSNNGTPASTAGGESLSPSNEGRFVLRSSPSRSASKTEDAVDTNVNPPKDSTLSSNATDEYTGSIIDGSKVSSSNVRLATFIIDGKSTTTEYEILDKSLEIEDLNLGEEEKKDDTNQGNGVADNMKAKAIDGDVAMLDYMSPSEDGEDEDVGEDTKQVSAESDDEVSTSSPTVNDRPSRIDTFKFNGSSFSVALIKVFSYIVSVIAIIGLMTLSSLGTAFSSLLGTAVELLLKDTNVAAASTKVPEKTAPGATAPATGALGSTPAAAASPSPLGASAANAYGNPTSSSFEQSAPAPGPDDFGGRTLKEKLTAFYKIHNPTKVSEVDKLVAKYAGKEEQMSIILKKEYGQDLSIFDITETQTPTPSNPFSFSHSAGR